MKKILPFLFLPVLFFSVSFLAAAKESPARSRQYYELRVYNLASAEQVGLVEQYLQSALVPALHRAGVKQVGVFQWLGNDTAAVKKIYVLIPYSSLKQVEKTRARLQSDASLPTAAGAYWNVAYNQPAYLRFETILLQAFPDHPRLTTPQLQGPRSERVYELRSYEGPSERLYQTKVHMFNQGGEVALFQRLGFNAVFYASVVAGAHMPNLMYMTTFENKASRDAHWKTFGDDPEWKRLSALPEYQHNVSHADILFLRPTAYSDF